MGCSPVDTAPTQCPGGHVFDSCLTKITIHLVFVYWLFSGKSSNSTINERSITFITLRASSTLVVAVDWQMLAQYQKWFILCSDHAGHYFPHIHQVSNLESKIYMLVISFMKVYQESNGTVCNVLQMPLHARHCRMHLQWYCVICAENKKRHVKCKLQLTKGLFKHVDLMANWHVRST